MISEYLPKYHIDNEHSIRINTSTAHAFTAFQKLTMEEIPVLRVLVWLRLLLGRLLRRNQVFDNSQRINQDLLKRPTGSNSVILSETVNKEIIVGFIGSFWKLSPSFQPLSNAQEFLVFHEPNNVKAVMQFSVHEREKGTEIKIRTRILALDAASKRKIIFYWGIIKYGIWIFRKSWLLAIKRRAESYY